MDDFDELARQALSPPGQVIPFPSRADAFDDLASQVVTMQRQAAAGTALSSAQGGGPDATARALTASRTAGMPMPSAEANPDAADAAALTEKNGSILFQNPKLASFMGANPLVARMAQDEFDHLDAISKTTAALSGGANAAMLQNRMGRLGTVKEMAEMVLGRTSPETDQQIEAIEQLLARTPQMHGALGFIHSVSGFVTGLVDNIAQGGTKAAVMGAGVGAAVGATAGGLGALPMAAAGFTLGASTGTYMDAAQVSAGNTYLRLSRLTSDTGQPISDAGKVFGSLFAGAATYALFKYQGDIEQKLFGDTANALVSKAIDIAVARPTFQAAMSGVVKATAAGATRGGVSMGVLEGANIIAEQAAKALSPGHFESDPVEMIQRIADAAVEGAVLFGAMHAAGAGMSMYGDLRNVQRAHEQMDMFKGLQDAASNSKLRDRDLQSFQDLMRAQLKGEPGDTLFIPAAKVLELYQGARIDPEVSRGADPLFGFVKDMPEQLREAAATGGDVVIPTADFVSHLAGTPISEKLLPDMRIGAESMSVNEAKIYAKEWGNRGKEALETAAKVKPEATDLIARDIQQQAEAAGSPKAEAGRYAQIAAARYATRAERLGVDVMALYKESPLTIREGIAPTEGELQQGTVTPSTDKAGNPYNIRISNETFGAAQDQHAVMIEAYTPDGKRAAFVDFEVLADGRLSAGNVVTGEPFRRHGLAEMLYRAAKDKGYEIAPGRAQTAAGTEFVRSMQAKGVMELRQEARGSIRFEGQAKIISMFEEADHSTLIHESGHAWLEELMSDALRPDAPQGLRDDAQATLKWLGVETRDQIGTAQHEQFARAAEAYFMEGKAPSRGLASIFSRFKQWLTRIYQSVSALETPINPEIRAVFDRLLATDEEIADARKTQGLEPMFRDRESAGMTSAEWKAYLSKIAQASQQAESKMLDKMMAKIRRERTAEYKAESAPIRAEVTKQVDAQPDMQALRLITKREDPMKISRSVAEQMYGKGVSGLPRGTLAEKGIHPDEIAELMGYGSGDEMMRALMDLEQRQREIRAADGEKRGIRQYLIDEGVRNRMAGSETLSEDSIRTEALAAVNGERAQELQALELRYLNRQAIQALVERGKGRKGIAEQKTAAQWQAAEADLMAKLDKAKSQAQIEKLQAQIQEIHERQQAEAEFARATETAMRRSVNVVQPILESLRAHADEIIEGKTADEISRSYFKWARDERKAAREVEEAVLAKDFNAAAAAKQRQLLAGIMFSKAKDAQAYVDRAMKSMDYISSRAKFDGIAQPFIDQLHALLGRFGFDVNRDQAELARAIGTTTLPDFVQDRFNDGYELPITPMVASSGMPAGSLKMAQFKELAEFVNAMRSAGREEQVVRVMGETFDRKEAVREMVDALSKLKQNEKGEYLYPEDRGFWFAKAEKAASFMRAMNASLLKKEAVFDWADGGKTDGPFNRFVFRPLKDASHKEMTLKTEAVESVRALEKELPNGWAKRLNDTIATTLVDPETGSPFKMTRKRLLSIALNWGTEDNATKLADGYGWNPRDIQQLLDRNMSKEDWHFVQGIWNMFEKYREPVDQLQRRVSGVGIEYVQGRRVGTPHGEIDGKYFPLVYDSSKSVVAERNLERSRDSLFENQYQRATTRNGSVISRVQGVRQPINLSLDIVPWKIGQTIHDLSFREALMQADKLLSDKAVISALDTSFSPEVRKTLRPWLQHIANVDNINDRSTAWLDKFLNSARSNATMLGIGFRATTAIKHGFSALSQTVTELGPKWAVRGFMESYGTPQQVKRNWQFALENSQELRFRPQMYDRDLQANTDRWITDGIGKRINSDLQHYGHFLVSYLDFGSAVPAWLGAYRKATESLGMEHQEAAYYADKVVRNAHGAQSIVDRAAIQESNSQLVKMSTMFYGFLNHMYNRGVVYPSRLAGRGMEQLRAGETGAAVRNFAEVAARTTGYLVVPGIVAGLVTKGPAQDEGWWHWAAEAVLHETAATVPIVREIANSALTGYDYEPTPLVRMVQTLMGTAKDIFSALGLREKDPSRKALRHFLESVGYLFGTPTGQAATTLQFLWDVNDGRADPQDLTDWLHGLAKGSVPKEQ